MCYSGLETNRLAVQADFEQTYQERVTPSKDGMELSKCYMTLSPKRS